jgi:hypothetical protein
VNGGQVQKALQDAGITMKVADPIDKLQGSQAQRELGGLVVTFQDGALNQLASQIPGLKQYVNFNQTMTMSFGTVTVNSDTLGGFNIHPPAQPPAQPGGPAPGPPPSSGGGGGTVPSFGGGDGGGGAFPTTSGGSTSQQPTVQAIGQTSLPSAPSGKGVPAIAAAIGLFLAAGSSRILRHIADGALSKKAVDRCPLERS